MGKDRTNGVTFNSLKLENHKLSLGASEEVTYVFNSSGADSGSSPYTIYFDMEREAIAVTVRATVVCSLTEVNGKTLKSPITINPGTNVMSVLISRMKIVSIGATILEVTAK